MTGSSSYHLRTLTDSDISSWANFCAQCFAYKSNPPPASYFERHFHNDPRKDSSLIRVIDYHNVDETTTKEDNPSTATTPTIVASTRVFQKTLSLGNNGKSIEAGGIGEVCTSEDHRKKGLAKRLLLNAIDVMENDRKMQCSLLHASAALTAVYERSAQYVCVNTKWNVMTIKTSELKVVAKDTTTTSTCQVRLASFPKDTTQLQRIHAQYSEQRFAGCVIRSETYWNEYLQYEIGSSLFVVTTSSVEGEDSILGWMSIRPRGGRFQLREFGVDLDKCRSMELTTSKIMSILLNVALSHEDTSSDMEAIELHIPRAIVEEMKSQANFNEKGCPWIDWTVAITDDDDIGWMYKIFDVNCDGEESNMIHLVNNLKVPHLIWPADSF